MSVAALWLANLELPDFASFEDRKVALSTKIYDRNGVVLYDIHQDIKRTAVPFSDISPYIKNATVAIEDSAFYQHNGIRLRAILRAVTTNLTDGNLLGGQGGSTITQQAVKLTLLTTEKTVSRKVKEWILSLKLEKSMTKEEILGIYLNEVPYGGSIYGVEEATQAFFSKPASDVTLAEAAYLAAVIQRPTYYSPYGNNKDKLDERKDVVLWRMRDLGFITDEEYEAARAEQVSFGEERDLGIKAPHFVLYVKEYLEEKYGEETVREGGLKVITTLDYALQEKAEALALEHALKNKEQYDAENAGIVAMDPKTGQILVMVGSRDYFDEEIDGKYNVALAKRQPGSSFKPFVYATAFKNGYTPETVLFDVATEFNASCGADGVARGSYDQEYCYMPSNFDNEYRGPMTLRDALAQSINVPAVKLLYLVGIDNAIKTAKELGITTLTRSPNDYGLSLVLGGGEVRLLDMVTAYGGFANNGVVNPYQAVLRVEDASGRVLEEFAPSPREVLPKNAALTLSSVLDDDTARIPTFGSGSVMNFGDRSVAAKTGTTNDYRDSWIVGYTPSLVAGVWMGNNDNHSMKNRPSAGALWRAFMDEALRDMPVERFEEPLPHPDYALLKPVFRGDWLPSSVGDAVSDAFDAVAGAFGRASTRTATREPHAILYYIDKDDIHGAAPADPENADSQFDHWEYAVRAWWQANSYKYRITENGPERIPGL